MNESLLLNEPAGRSICFLPAFSDPQEWVRTIIAFANGVGGDLFIGMNDAPREVTGVPEKELFAWEEKILKTVSTQCAPAILPQVSFLRIAELAVVKITVVKGSEPPYHLVEKGVEDGTYIRFGTTNRLADGDYIAALKRQRLHHSFDRESYPQVKTRDLDIESFKRMYLEKNSEFVTASLLRRMGLTLDSDDDTVPTNALVLLSDGQIKEGLFPSAIIECMRFRGNDSSECIDEKVIATNIAEQPEAAYQFILGHIHMGTRLDGLYSIPRWEYPVKAIREALYNAVIHRDYALKDLPVRVFVYDDRIEICSPGLPLSSIRFDATAITQVAIRNKQIYTVFQRLGLIDRWGEGLSIMTDELLEYPEIGIKREESDLYFRLTFGKGIKKEDRIQLEVVPDYKQELFQSLNTTLSFERDRETLYSSILRKLLHSELSRKQLSQKMKQKTISGQLNKIITRLLNDGLIGRTIEEKPNHPYQKFRITEKGRIFVDLLNNKKKR
ncbi:RNA-binding domain-containing protein [Parabacteroides sp. PF5-9]|uniref:RNA-binding domain-containing protein n=1 Tax=Parabacteroides sp. PF5-9 TaxID=1742404 RepID=UPI002476441F|nr:RNA-binding domain-containing protein [Parabacteroides sp. PF5-9]MDH6357110.1 ATP-dependent DNA helicase RecG [Parabacteroides sp. PF5-9]